MTEETAEGLAVFFDVCAGNPDVKNGVMLPVGKNTMGVSAIILCSPRGTTKVDVLFRRGGQEVTELA